MSPADTHLSRLSKAMDLTLLWESNPAGPKPGRTCVMRGVGALRPILSVPGAARQHKPSRAAGPTPADDLHLSQRRRKGFVGGNERGSRLADSVFRPTVSRHGGGDFDLTCSF